MKIKKKSGDTSIIMVAGGIGKNILATAVIASFKEANPRSPIVIATGHPFVWTNNPHVEQVLDFEKRPNIYEEIVKKRSCRLYLHDPYHTDAFMNRREHLLDAWCRLLGVEPVIRETHLYWTDAELSAAKKKLPPDGKPIFLIQTNGGAPRQHSPYSWARDLR